MDRLALPLFAALLPELVSPAWCERLRQRATSLGFLPTSGAYPPGYRNNDRLVLDDPALAEELWAMPMVRALLATHRAFLDETLGEEWEVDRLNTRFRFCRYENGQAFVRHRDGAYQPNEDERSFLTLQLYLDEDFAGGATRFFRAGSELDRPDEVMAVSPRTGHAIVFDHRLWHDGEPVFRGKKHVLRTDVMFRRASTRARVSPTEAAPPYLFVARRARDAGGDEHLLTGGRDGVVTAYRVDADDLVPRARVRIEGEGPASSVTALATSPTAARGPSSSAHGDHLLIGRRDGCLFGCTMDQFLDEVGDDRWRRTPLAVLASAITGLCSASLSREIWATTAGDGVVSIRWSGGGGPDLVKAWRLHVSQGASYEAARDGWLWACSEAPSGEGFAVGDAGLFRLVASSRAGSLLRSPVGLRSIAVSPGGRVAVGDRGGFVHLDLPSGRGLSFRAHTGAIRAIAFDDGDEHTLITASEDTTVARFDLRPSRVGALLERQESDDFVCSVQQLGDKSVIAVGYDGRVHRLAGHTSRSFTPATTSTKFAPPPWPRASKI